MKKYNLFLGITALLLAVNLSACGENKGTRTVVYTEPLPYLTVMTQTTTTPADTYSEYMATYTEKETGTENFFAIPNMYGVGADTAMTNFPAAAETPAPVTDTAAVIPQTGTMPPPEIFTETTETVSSPEEASSSETTEASGTESTGTSSVTGYVTSTITSQLGLPAPDTVSPYAVQADTAPTMYSISSDNSGTDTDISNGGTDNAN